MKQFDHSFYTDDFDQEMLDFIKENFKIDSELWDIEDPFLNYGELSGDFWLSTINGNGAWLTRQEFKDRIGMTNEEKHPYKIYINVTSFDENKRKRVQDAFFKLGIMWMGVGTGYHYLHDYVEGYTNITYSGNVDDRLMYHTGGVSDCQQQCEVSFEELMEIAGMTKTNSNLERWKNGDKRLQITLEGKDLEFRKHVLKLFKLLGWCPLKLNENNYMVKPRWSNTFLGEPKPCTDLLYGNNNISNPDYPLSTVEDIEEIIKYEESKNMKKEDNTFTKDMLVSGEHVVECRNGDKYLVFKNHFIDSGGYNELEDYKDDLTLKDTDEENSESVWDIVAVYKHVVAPKSLKSIFEEGNLTLVWQRTSSEKLKLLEEVSSVEEEIKTLQERLYELKFYLGEIGDE